MISREEFWRLFRFGLVGGGNPRRPWYLYRAVSYLARHL